MDKEKVSIQQLDRNDPRYRKGLRKATKKDCNGCEDDFYNGHNDLGIKECWHLDTATMAMRKKVPLDQRPPWAQKAERVPSCYRQKGFVFVNANRTC